MDRLPVFKALGDNTRYAIYLELARAERPLSTSDIAESLDLHPNTVRPHLERMREVGLLDVEIDNRGTVGRPQHRYSLAADAPSLGLEPSAFRTLARLLAAVAAAGGAGEHAARDVGRAEGRAAAEGIAVADGIARAEGATRAQICIDALVAQLTDLGFDPAAAADGGGTTVAFTHCPYRELAQAFPELVCSIHRGICEGFVEEVGGATVVGFGSLLDRDPCRVDLANR